MPLIQRGLILSKNLRRIGASALILLLFCLMTGMVHSPLVKVEKPLVDPKLLYSVQTWAHKQHYIIPDGNDLHMAIKAGIQNNVDPLLILAVIGVESSFKATARSNADGRGYMQVVPKWHREKIDDESKLLDPEYNITIGTRILAEYIGRSRTIEFALQRYNGLTGKTNYSDKVLKVHNNLLKEIKDNESKMYCERL